MKKLTQSAFVMGALLYAFTAEDSEKKKTFKRQKEGGGKERKKELGSKDDVSQQSQKKGVICSALLKIIQKAEGYTYNQFIQPLLPAVTISNDSLLELKIYLSQEFMHKSKIVFPNTVTCTSLKSCCKFRLQK